MLRQVPDEHDETCDIPTCPICGEEMVWEQCWQCQGDGGFHDCGEDCCPCLCPELNETCNECYGNGGYCQCSALPHSPEQLAAYEQRQQNAAKKGEPR